VHAVESKTSWGTTKLRVDGGRTIDVGKALAALLALAVLAALAALAGGRRGWGQGLKEQEHVSVGRAVF
jgi:hypothetical protein